MWVLRDAMAAPPTYEPAFFMPAQAGIELTIAAEGMVRQLLPGCFVSGVVSFQAAT